jgi:hypothetical protein
VIKAQNLRRELESKRIEAREKEEQLKKARQEQAKTRGTLDTLMDIATPLIQESLFGKKSEIQKQTEEKLRKSFPQRAENAEILAGPTNVDLSKLTGITGQAIRDWSDNVKSLIQSNEQKIAKQLRDIEKLEQDLDELQSVVEQLRLEKKTLKTDLDNCIVGSANIIGQLDFMDFTPDEADEFIGDIARIIGNVESERREFTEREMKPYIEEFNASLEELAKISQTNSAKRVARRVNRAGRNVVEQHQLHNQHGLQANGRNVDLMGDGKVASDRRSTAQTRREKERLKAEVVKDGVEISPRQEGEKQQPGLLDMLIDAIIPPAPPLPDEKENIRQIEPQKQTSLFDELLKEGSKILKPVEKEKVTENAPNVENTLMSQLWSKISALRSSVSDEDDFEPE